MTTTKQQGPILDVVGAVEAKEILGVELQRISRWRGTGKLPPPYAALVCSPVWVRADIEYLKEYGESNGFTPPPKQLPLLGTSEVAKLLAVNKSQVSRWRSSPPKSGPKFPEPVAKIAAGPLWDRRAVQAFSRARKRAK